MQYILFQIKYNTITYDNYKISINIVTYDLMSVCESIFVPFKLTIPFSFSMKKQIWMIKKPNTSVALFSVICVTSYVVHILLN